MTASVKQLVMLFMTALFIHTSAEAQRDDDRYRNDPYDDRYDDRYDNRYNDRYDNRRHNNRNYYGPAVRHRPPPPRAIRKGRAPSAFHIWLPAEYVWRGGRYVVVPGYWVRPPRPGLRYVSGYWQAGRGGFVWVSGRWAPINNRRW